MKALKKQGTFGKLIIIGILYTALFSCEKNDSVISTTFLNSEDHSVEFRSNGGSSARIWTFESPGTTANWNMSIDANYGRVQFILEDANGETMLDTTLTAGVGLQEAERVSSSGFSGTWTANIKMQNFNGSGSYSVL